MVLAAIIPSNSDYVQVFPGGTYKSGTPSGDFSPKPVNPLKVRALKKSKLPQQALNVGKFPIDGTLPTKLQIKSQPFIVGRSGVRKRKFNRRR